MNTCEWAERIAPLLDEEVHAAACAECMQLLEELEHDRELLRSMPVPETHQRRRRPWAAIAAALLC